MQSVTSDMLNAPGSSHSSLSVDTFPYDNFMGSWHVVWSTLPLWKGKKDVKITYTPMVGSSNREKFDDLVEYRKVSASSDSTPSSVHGVSKRDASVPANGVTFNWRGKGLLMIATSRWELLGYDTTSREPQWAVTYFSKTLFTPAGLDIYLRAPLTSEEQRSRLNEIVSALQAMNGDPGKLSQSGFIVGEA